MSLDRLIEKIAVLKNPTVAGLDPKLSYIPSFIREESFGRFGETLEGASDALLQFNRGLIDALCDIVPAVKPQCAYYEMYGWPGVRALYETIRYAQEKGMFVITDGKRNDIGSTMEAYATAHLGKVAVENNTLAPFGGDAFDTILEQTFGKALFFFKLPIILALVALILQFVFLRLGKPVWFSIFSGLLALVFIFTVSFFASAVGRNMEWLAVALQYVFATVMAGTFITYGFYNE